jgi:hypothetical protein
MKKTAPTRTVKTPLKAAARKPKASGSPARKAAAAKSARAKKKR